MKKLIVISSLVLGITGCSSLDNPCNDQGAGSCASVTTAYENSLKDTVNPADLPRGQSSSSSSTGSSKTSSSNDLVYAYNQQHSYSQIPQSGDALRTTPKTMRVWILPYEDDVGLYHDQQYVYALVEKGIWKYKSTSLKTNSSPYIKTYAGDVSPSSYQPFVAKESDAIANNQSLISAVGGTSGTSPFSAEAVANKNAAVINSVGQTSN